MEIFHLRKLLEENLTVFLKKEEQKHCSCILVIWNTINPSGPSLQIKNELVSSWNVMEQDCNVHLSSISVKSEILCSKSELPVGYLVMILEEISQETE